jgi:hypothetical protein
MKRAIYFFFAMCALLSSGAPFGLAAADDAGEATIPAMPPEPADAPGRETEMPPAIIALYPSDVTETDEGGARTIAKTYELRPDEDPAGIPREPLERDGWRYSLTDITRRETTNTEMREHAETVTLDTDTKEPEKILALLAPATEYKAEDGFAGLLPLDVSSIKVEEAGRRTSRYTMNVTREYPHLSSNDMGFVPKTVEEKGTTYTLTDVDWRAGSMETVDCDALPAYYTAYATYTATGTSTKVTGYTVTAVYRGTLARLTRGSTRYTAYFLGEEMRTEPESGELTTTERTAAAARSDIAWFVLPPILGAAVGTGLYFRHLRKVGNKGGTQIR